MKLVIFLAVFTMIGTLSLSAPAHADIGNVPPPPIDWRSSKNSDHPLVGKIWSRKKDDFVTAQEFGTALSKARFLLLGEIHDNPDHHAWQAWAIRNVSKLHGEPKLEGSSQIAVVAMEMLRADQIGALNEFYGRDGKTTKQNDAQAFRRITNWDKSGWPSFEIYEPVISAALDEGIVIVPANPSKEETKSVSFKGISALADDRAERMALSKPLSEDYAKGLTSDIEVGHCNLLPKSSIPAMAFVQRFRDAVMADALLNITSAKAGILIAGNGHVRRDRAVPWYLRARGVPEDSILTVMHVEVGSSEQDADNYVKPPDGGEAIADYVVFTPATERENMCDKMREAIKNLPKARKSPK